MIIRLIAGLIKKMLLYKMKQYFPKLNEHFDRDISVKKKQQVLIHLIWQ